MSIRVKKELYVKAPDKQTAKCMSQFYVNGTGLRRVEHQKLQRESDWSNAMFERYSDDNGRTWGEWKDVYSNNCEIKANDEINIHYGNETYNPLYGHFVSIGMRRIFFEGHEKAYKRYWGNGEDSFVDHSLLVIRKDGKEQRAINLIKYEDGADYDDNNWRNPEYINNNRAYFGYGVNVLENGEIIFAIAPNIKSCCRILGADINEVFPSCPEIMCGMIVVRGKFNEALGNYELSFSRPIIISDLKSSRGVCEPDVIMLPSGRILAVFRGSNVESKNWKTRIEKGTPTHKWYCYSDNGGKTFTEPVPWHFDDQEVFYSAATICAFVKSIKNQKVYWIGNISNYTSYGNYPRHPLIIAEVNERGLLVKDTLTTIDKREEADSDKVQLSNFSILQDRETGLIEVYLNKIGQHEGFNWWADSYRYFIDVSQA